MEVVTKQKCDELVYLLRHKQSERESWFYVLIPYNKLRIVNDFEEGKRVNLTNCYRYIEYRDEQGSTKRLSGFGKHPPANIVEWINQNYGPAAVDENASLHYTADDIRFCTIHHSSMQQSIGVRFVYHKHEQFYYVAPTDNFQGTLAFRAGIKIYDRIIELNGINVENESDDEVLNSIASRNQLTMQLLLCSPATYAHYHTNNKQLDNSLETIKLMRPVRNEYVQDENKTLTYDGQTLFVSNNGSSEKKSSERPVKKEKHEIDKRDRIIMHLIGMLMDATHGDDENAHRISCDGCHNLRIYTDRYKCLQCENYDLCGDCFERGRETNQHKSGHAFAHFKVPMELFGETITNANKEVTLEKFKERFANVEHSHVTCDGCGKMPIIGIRFKCDTCHDYDLCLDCMEKQIVTKEHDKKHSLIVIGKDRFYQIDINDIELGDELGRGAFGSVHKAKWISKNRQVACKILTIPPDKAHLEQSFLRELAAYTEVSGAYILKLYGYAIEHDSTNDIRKCLLIMEYMSRGSLTNVIKQEKKLSLRRKLELACHIASGMRKLHTRHMIHRDIRPDNILVNENYVAKIGDMGIARVMEENNRLTVIGCGHYMPPEFITGRYDQSLDIFTFGLTLNHLFTEKQHQSVQFIITKVKLVEESPIFSELIARCIHNNPSQRPTAVEIEATLHTYKRGFDKIILQENAHYIQLSTEDKNKVFLKFYEIFHPQAKIALQQRFPPPPPLPPESHSEETTEGIDLLQLFDHIMHVVNKKEKK